LLGKRDTIGITRRSWPPERVAKLSDYQPNPVEGMEGEGEKYEKLTKLEDGIPEGVH